MADDSFLTEWAGLLDQCRWATPFQKHQFAASWYAAYKNAALPIVATGRAANGKLVALFAGGQTANGMCAVGGPQAEYPCWLFAPDQVGAFDCLIDVMESKLGRVGLLFQYLPPGFPIGELCKRSKYRLRLATRDFARPLMNLTTGAADASLKKKGNKSKLSRLKRIGPVEFEVIDNTDDFERIFDTIIEQYDSRLRMTAGVSPFASDPNKKTFHIEMMRRGLLHVSVLRAGDAIVAAHIGAKGEDEVHESIVSFDESVASESPNKLLLLLLAQRLAKDGYKTFDLTPGGDAWKNRFATDMDKVIELRLYTTANMRLLDAINRRGRKILRSLLNRLLRLRAGSAEDQGEPDRH